MIGLLILASLIIAVVYTISEKGGTNLGSD